jgi:DNA gyrase subunit A
MGRAAGGVLGIRLRPGDEVVGAAVVGEKPEILTVTDQGFATRTRVEEYRLQARGGAGVRNVRVGPKNGQVVAIRGVGPEDELLLVSEGGQILRTSVREIRTVGRGAQGVRVMRLAPGDRVSAVAVVEPPQG